MKKIIASTALAGLLFSVNADTTVVTAHEEPAIVEQAPEECCTPDFGGIQFILGIGGSFLKAELKDKDHGTNEKISKNANRFIGTVGIGGGNVFKDKFYAGLEVLFDFTKAKDWSEELTYRGIKQNVKLKSNGLFTSLGLRLGYIVPKYNTMVYFKVAGSHSSVKASDVRTPNLGSQTVEIKAAKIVPTLALGVEKAFCKKFTARLEGEYRFKGTKKVDGYEVRGNDGFNIRALVSYNVRF